MSICKYSLLKLSEQAVGQGVPLCGAAALSRQMPCVRVPIGQNVHHARGRNQSIAASARISEVSIRLYRPKANCAVQGGTSAEILQVHGRVTLQKSMTSLCREEVPLATSHVVQRMLPNMAKKKSMKAYRNKRLYKKEGIS